MVAAEDDKESRKRKFESLERSEIRRNADGSVGLVAAAPVGEMSYEQAKALLERAGVKTEKKAKKDKKEKGERKDKKAKKGKSKKGEKKRHSKESESGSGSDSGGGGRGGGGGSGGGSRQWMRGSIPTGDTGGKKRGKDKDSWGKPVGPEASIEPISEDDYFLKNHEVTRAGCHTP